MTRELSRRALLAGGGSLLAATSIAPALSGCSLLSTKPTGNRREEDDAGAAERARAREAPMLAAKVEAGDLPPLLKRLPGSPLVVKPVDRIGVYGGTWQSVFLGPADTTWLWRTAGYDNLVRWTPDFTKVVPNVAKSVEVGGDGRTYTFRLRAGMRWSDGAAFTAADVVFAVNDVLLDADLYPDPPAWLLSGGKPPRVERLDETAVRFVFASPHGLFLENLATTEGKALTSLPRHHLERYHRKHNPDVAKLAEQEGFADWVKLFAARGSGPDAPLANPDLPTLCAWKFTTTLGKGTRMVAERNPYYWKTDPEGRQLPYIDTVRFDLVGSDQVILLRAGNAELGMHCRHINTLRNKPVLARSRQKGGFKFFDLPPALMNDLMIALNLNHEDPAMREVFQNRDFRIALSHAIDRPELIKAVLQGQGTPWQGAPREESDFFDEEFATQFTKFEPDVANSLLDGAGYRRDSDGRRLRPDGEVIRFAVEVPTPTFKDFWVDALSLIKKYWADVGVEIQVKNEDRALFYERKQANKHDATVWQGPGGLQDALLDPRWYFPFSGESNFATLWATWFTTGGRGGEEPPAPARRQMELYDQVVATADKDQQRTLFAQILQIAKEEFWAIGTVLPANGYGIVSDRFHNVPARMVDAFVYPTPGPTNPEQYFISD
jgi:ABC-type transport system substrate-binding protein